MRLLIYTQSVDKNDPILGFFHRWLLEFAKHFEHIYVICLKEGVHELPSNVTVLSLGKEKGESRVKYIARFYNHLFSLAGAYDRVFVHMNPHYVVLGGWYWRLKHIPIFFWRNHARMNLMTRIAAAFAKHVFYTSPYACTSRFAHALQMPVGIDDKFFRPEPRKEAGRKILFLGRISPVKRVEVFISVARLLPDCEFHIYGDAPAQDREYGSALKKDAPLNVRFHPAVKNDETLTIYSTHDLYVNLTPEGSMDKTVLEAALCGIAVIVSNDSFRGVLPGYSFLENVDPLHIAQKITTLMELEHEEKATMMVKTRSKVAERHSLERLGQMLYNYMV